MPRALEVLERDSFDTLHDLADSEDRAIDQEARFLLRKAIEQAVAIASPAMVHRLMRL